MDAEPKDKRVKVAAGWGRQRTAPAGGYQGGQIEWYGIVTTTSVGSGSDAGETDRMGGWRRVHGA
jgi:hypothetical protein